MKIDDILEAYKQGEISEKEAKEQILHPLEYATIDLDREKRTGAPEIIYGAGKTAEQIKGIIGHMRENGIKNIFATRVNEKKAESILSLYPQFHYDMTARTLTLTEKPYPLNKGKIVVACAGTSDLPAALEAVNTARFLGNEVELIADIGVAGISRLFARLDDIREANVLVVAAGMEGALASVIGGLVTKPVIALPTSVGYGASFNGLSALLAMLNSCANGISVVNIDNGFGAGYNAHLINSLSGKRDN